ncbi:MAG TPA: hypothetical protein PLX58_00185 [Smithellaceae bacterium]|nr:hypothetical protein [Smithellaceae bacterium]HQG80990.1 hypothetical protein [Smithellaceae bacterium]
MEENIRADEKFNEAKKLTMIIYALYAASFLVGVTSIFAIIINYIKKDEMAGTVLESHFRWQMRTFWFGLLWAVLGVILAFVIVGFVVLLVNAIWIIYRIAKGWLNLNENKPMYSVS